MGTNINIRFFFLETHVNKDLNGFLRHDSIVNGRALSNEIEKITI